MGFCLLTKCLKNIHIAICTKNRILCSHLRCRGEGGAAQVTHLPVGSDGFPRKTAVFNRRGRTDC